MWHGVHMETRGHLRVLLSSRNSIWFVELNDKCLTHRDILPVLLQFFKLRFSFASEIIKCFIMRHAV